MSIGDREAQELVRELVGDRVAQHQEVGVGLDDRRGCTRAHAQWKSAQLEALLDVGVLVDDPGLERREVGRGARRELVDERCSRSSAVARRSVAIARVTEVKYSLNELRSPARPMSLT